MVVALMSVPLPLVEIGVTLGLVLPVGSSCLCIVLVFGFFIPTFPMVGVCGGAGTMIDRTARSPR